MNSNLKLVFDIDGTLCPIKDKDELYENLVPDHEMIQRMKAYKEKGATIVLYTSRNMNSYQGNLGLINAKTAKILLAWLDKWGIPYDEILYGKPWPGKYGFYIDDRAVRPDEFLQYDADELMDICKKSSRKGTDK